MTNTAITTCIYCNRTFPTEKDVMRHECTDHLHIDPDEYQKYLELSEKAITAFHNKQHNPNPNTKRAYRIAIRNMNTTYKNLTQSIEPEELAKYEMTKGEKQN